MKTILCITPNPAIDRTLLLPEWQSGGVMRATQAITAAGGKGLNVARALRNIGADPSLSMAPLAGHSGRLLAEMAQNEGLAAQWTWLPDGETRTCIILLPENAPPSVVNTSGDAMSAENWDAFCTDVAWQAKNAALVTISGSFPPGLPASAPAALVAEAKNAGGSVWVDSSGAALVAAVKARPSGIKINVHEANGLLGMQIGDTVAAKVAARRLQQQGIANVVITLGRDGAIFCAPTSCWYAAAPPVEAVSNVGSGDSFFAGLAAGLVSGATVCDALRMAVAAGSANTLSAGAAIFERTVFEKLLSQISCEQI